MKLKEIHNSDQAQNVLHEIRKTIISSIQVFFHEWYNYFNLNAEWAKEVLERNELENKVPMYQEQRIDYIDEFFFKDANGCEVKYQDTPIETLIDIYDFLCDYVEHDIGVALPDTMAEILLDGQVEADKDSVSQFIDEQYDDHKYDCCEDLRNAYLTWKNK